MGQEEQYRQQQRRHDSGAAGVEIAGVTLLVAAFMAAAVSAAALTGSNVIGDNVAASICRAFAMISVTSDQCAESGAYDDTDGPASPSTGTPVEEQVPYEEREWTYDEITSGPMVFIGDSFGSGEGAKDYTHDTDRDYAMVPDYDGNWQGNGQTPHRPDYDQANKCHRSRNAWGIGIGDQHWPDNYNFNACSGATTHHVQNPNGSNHGEGPQAEDVDEDTGMIFISMGGNDAGFADVLEKCVKSHNFYPWSPCRNYFNDTDPDDPHGRTRMEVTLAELEDRIRTMYQYLKDESGENAHIVHMGYPHLFDPDYYGMSVSNADALWMNEMADEVNALMASIAREEGVHFIDPTEAFAGHGIGSDDPWILNLGVGGHRALPPESFHPTAEGQAAYQALVEEYLNSLP